LQIQNIYVLKNLRFLLFIVLMIFANHLFAQDSIRRIEILRGRDIRQKTINDSTVLQTLAGDAMVKQGNTLLSGDSIVLNQRTNIAEVFGNVHVNDADSVHTYASYLRYVGRERIAYLKRNVKLTDGKGTLLTDDLVYNLATGIATYSGGGKVINGKTVLTSSDAVYYSDTKDVYFKKYVHLVDPKYDIVADSLLYNTQLKEAHFIAPTRIKTPEGKLVNTRNGIYNLETGESSFYERTSFSDSTHFVIADRIFNDDKKGISVLEGTAKVVDSVSKVIVLGNKIERNSKENSFLATQKPIMIFYKGKDSTYLTGDTLFSGLRKNDISNKSSFTKVDTIKNQRLITEKPKDDSVRYFLAYQHVKIYNDSAQAVSDSLYYSTEDSVFRLFKQPVFWNGKSQVSGDTMYLFTANQKPKRLYVFNNSIIINQANPALYNQAGGRTLNAYFVDGEIDYSRIKGSPAETVFYPQDEDSSYIGMNRSSGDAVDVFFVKKAVNKIKFINNVNGTLYPLSQIPADKKYLKNFKWQDKRRPKNKLELFE
jgi:lipopolysaccharide export system protein LptA